MLPIQKKYVNYNYSKRSSKPQYLILHDTGNPGAGAENHYKYFNSGNKNASADFFVDSNNIIQIINTDVNYSWAVGDGKGAYGITNSNSCSVEMCLEADGQPSEATLKNTLELFRYLMTLYNIPVEKVARHYDASRKSCPNSFKANGWAKWNEFKAKLSGQTVAETPVINTPVATTPQPTQSQYDKAKEYNKARCLEIQQKLNKIGYSLVEDGIYGNATHSAIGNYQGKNGLTVDYLMGSASFSKLDSLIASKNVSNAKENVKKIQRLCNSVLGSNLVCDGLWGSLTEAQVKRLPLCGLPYTQRECTRFVQEVLGLQVDGIFGNLSAEAVYKFQCKYSDLENDKIVGFKTYKALATK